MTLSLVRSLCYRGHGQDTAVTVLSLISFPVGGGGRFSFSKGEARVAEFDDASLAKMVIQFT